MQKPLTESLFCRCSCRGLGKWSNLPKATWLTQANGFKPNSCFFQAQTPSHFPKHQANVGKLTEGTQLSISFCPVFLFFLFPKVDRDLSPHAWTYQPVSQVLFRVSWVGTRKRGTFLGSGDGGNGGWAWLLSWETLRGAREGSPGLLISLSGLWSCRGVPSCLGFSVTGCPELVNSSLTWDWPVTCGLWQHKPGCPWLSLTFSTRPCSLINGCVPGLATEKGLEGWQLARILQPSTWEGRKESWTPEHLGMEHSALLAVISLLPSLAKLNE